MSESDNDHSVDLLKLSDYQPIGFVEAEEMIQHLPAEKQTTYREIALQRQFSGPLPSPAMLAQYDQVDPGAAHQIVTLTVDEQQHRHKFDQRALAAEERYRLCALLVAGVAVVGLFLTIYSAIVQQATEIGVAVAGIGCVGLVGVLVRGRKRQTTLSAYPPSDPPRK